MMVVTDENYKDVVKSEKLVVLDFYADWCGPCKTMSPILDRISEANKDIIVGKINVDDAVFASNEYGIRNIPTIMFFKNGKQVGKIVGSNTEAVIQSKINEFNKIS